MNSSVFRRACAFRALVGISMLTLSTVAMSAPTLVGTPTNASGIDTPYDWTLAGGGDSGSGTLVTGAAAGSGFDVLSFNGTIDGHPVALTGGQPGPLGAHGGGGFFYDNILYPTTNPGTPVCAGGNSVVDGCGILFTINGTLGNIFINFPGSGVSGTGPDVLQIAAVSLYSNGSTNFTIEAVPEPLTLSLFGAGLVGLGLSWRRLAR